MAGLERSMQIGWMLVLTSAAAYALAFPPVSFAPALWIALAPLFAACARVGPLRAAALAGGFGVVAGVAVASWLPSMLHDFFGVPAGRAHAASAAVFVLFAGSYYALFGAWLGWAARRGRASPLLVALAFAGCELARANGFVPNPWALTAHSQLASPLVQVADLAGAYGVAALVAGVNAAIAALFVPALRTRSRAHTLATTALAVVLAWGYGAWRLGQPIGDASRAVSVAVLHLPGGAGVDRVPAIATAATTRPDLLVWPESAVDFSLREPSAETNGLLRTARASGTRWLVGAPDERRGIERTRHFNSLFLIQDGRLAAQLDKVELMPFAEHNPLRGWVAFERAELTPGARVRTLPLGETRFAAAICSEAMDPGYVRRLVAAGAEWIANPAKDRWFGSPAAAELQLAAARLRAIESRRFLARAAAGGVSAIVDAHGRVIARADGPAPERLEAGLAPSRTRTVYQRTGDAPMGLAAGVALGLPFLPVRRPRRQPSPRRMRRSLEVRR